MTLQASLTLATALLPHTQVGAAAWYRFLHQTASELAAVPAAELALQLFLTCAHSASGEELPGADQMCQFVAGWWAGWCACEVCVVPAAHRRRHNDTRHARPPGFNNRTCQGTWTQPELPAHPGSQRRRAWM